MKQVLMYTGDYCPHCKSAKSLLESKNVEIKEIDVSKNPNKRDEMQERTGGAKTIPQIFIGDHYIGGNAELQAANRSGELDKLLT
jgi:glutaredoxin 3